MFKLVVFFSVFALAAAKSGWVAPLAYSSIGVVPAVSSVSQYSSEVYHGTPIAQSVYSGFSPVVSSYSVIPGVPTFFQAHHSPAVVHTIAKRSVPGPIAKRSVPGPIAYTSPIAYSTPSVAAYNAPGYAYSALIGPPGPVWSGKALSVHPW